MFKDNIYRISHAPFILHLPKVKPSDHHYYHQMDTNEELCLTYYQQQKQQSARRKNPIIQKKMYLIVIPTILTWEQEWDVIDVIHV